MRRCEDAETWTLCKREVEGEDEGEEDACVMRGEQSNRRADDDVKGRRDGVRDMPVDEYGGERQRGKCEERDAVDVPTE